MNNLQAEFEEEFAKALGVSYAVATTSGSTALLLAVMASGIEAGDEVIVPNRTWIATAHAAYMVGAKVILADVLPNVPVIDPEEIERKITKKTKAIMPVHLSGRSDSMHIVNKIAKENGLIVIEDAAQALLSKNSEGFLGTQSLLGCFSFSVAKLITTGQGGMVVTKDKSLYEKMKLIRTHGVSDVINVTYTQFGFNFRPTDILSSIGIEQLKKTTERIEHLRKVYDIYKEGLVNMSDVKLIPIDVTKGEVPLYIEVMCSDRAKIMTYLSSNGFQTRPFYGNVNRADYFHNEGDFVNSDNFEKNGLYLPCGVEQPLENVHKVVELLKKMA